MKYLILLNCLLFSMSSYSKIVARVIHVSGSAFSFYEKKADGLKYGSKIKDLSEVMVEDGAALSVVNPNGDVFHINGGSLVKFYEGIVELKNGHIWVKSKSKKRGLFNTPNSVGEYSEGEFIYSFDNISAKTQLLVLTGEVKFSNALEPSSYTKIKSGEFSLVDQKYENGLPRPGTKVGLDSYKKMKQVFANFENLESNKFDYMVAEGSSKVQRGIASVNINPSSEKKTKNLRKKGKVIRLKTVKAGTQRSPASVSPVEYYKNMRKKESRKFQPIKSNKVAPINYYGEKFKPQKQSAAVDLSMPRKITFKNKSKQEQTQSQDQKRAPASIGSKTKLIQDLQRSGFESSLNRESKKIQRHSDEVNHLIDELKTYKQDFQKSY